MSEISLQEFQGVPQQEPKIVSPSDIAPVSAVAEADSNMLGDVFTDAFAAAKAVVEADQKKAEEIITDKYEEFLAGASSEDEDRYVSESSETDEEEPTELKKNIKPASVSSNERFDDEDDAEEKTDDEKLKMISSALKEKIKPVTDAIDLKSFTISKKPIRAIHAFESIADKSKFIADWPLMHSGVLLSMEEFAGSEIQRLDPANSRRNEYNTYEDIYGLIYSKITNPDKPSFETFLKLIKFADVQNLYMLIYRSSFNNKNTIPYECRNPKCGKVFVEDVPMDEIYSFVSDEIAAKFDKLMQGSKVFQAEEYEVELLQISDNYVIGLREPSIWNSVFEPISTGKEFREKNAEILALCTFIDSLYLIDRQENNLVPVELKEYPKDLGKTVRNKVVQFSKLIEDHLTSDQYYNLTMTLSKLGDKEEIEYFTPARKCPHCGKEVPKISQSPEALLFIRHQLAAMITT